MNSANSLSASGKCSGFPELSAMYEACADLLAPPEAEKFSLVVKRPASTAEAGEAAVRKLLEPLALPPVLPSLIDHDARHAPVIKLSPDIGEQPVSRNILISLTDEDDYACALAVAAPPSSALGGIGVDLASVEDFCQGHRSSRFFEFLFTPSELSYLHQFPQEKWKGLAAALFSAKESAIKSVAPLVRSHEASHFDCRLSARFSELEIQPDGAMGRVAFRGLTLENMQKIGVERIVCVLFPGDCYAFTAAKCIFRSDER